MSDFNLHVDPDLFREAVTFTAAETKFLPRLIEKDYFCSLLLEYFIPLDTLVFKGGTCLAKVHADFYRLSEYLDFTISIPLDSSRKMRQKAIVPVKAKCTDLAQDLPSFSFIEALKGANNSTQYLAMLSYKSVVTSNTETIKVEISLREPLVRPSIKLQTNTILVNPANRKRYFAPLQVRCISREEAYAEKYRAALSRREAAIRDFYDIDYAIRKFNLDPTGDEFIQMVRGKLAIPGNVLSNTFATQDEVLTKQLETELMPVIRNGEYENFDLDRACKYVSEMYRRL
jgi:predicted nucleotidyltransferase component of viral defense system